MCGLIGYVGENAAFQMFAGLAFLQHRGQDSAGIAVMADEHAYVEKGFGIAEEAFSAEKLANLSGNFGVGHVRYSTSGSAKVLSEIQPFYINQPYGMILAHNGNLTNQQQLRQFLSQDASRHINSASDSEILVNVLAAVAAELARSEAFSPQLLFQAVKETQRHLQGAYSVVVLIVGYGLLAFRDPHGIRPLVYGNNGSDWLVASENAAFRPLGFTQWKDVAPGEAIFIDQQKKLHRQQCADHVKHLPCMFEYIYLARPDSTLEGVSVYKARLNMGRKLGEKIRREYSDLEIDCIVPVPDSGRVAALELAHSINIPYREALVKNRHVGRTFITAGQKIRADSARKKLNVIESEFRDKCVMLVDDSIVRGTTGRQLVELARAAGAKQVYFASAAPPVCYPNVYGIDISTRAELLASTRSEAAIAAYLGADKVIYQSVEDLVAAVREENSALEDFEMCCFDGNYRVGEIDQDYLEALEKRRAPERDNLAQGDLPFNLQ